MKPRIVSFDFACTLFWEPGCDPKYDARYVRDALWNVLSFIERRGFEVDKPVDPWKTYLSVWDEIRSNGPRREIWHRYILLRFLYRLGINIDSYLLDEIYEYFISQRIKHYTLHSGVESILKYLVGRGYQLILTTGTASHDLIVGVIKYWGLDKYFKLIYSTQLVGIPKDDPSFYRELTMLLDLRPDEIIHIGDSLRYDIHPARAVGLKTIYFGWRTWCRAVDPQPCITSLWDLFYLL